MVDSVWDALRKKQQQVVPEENKVLDENPPVEPIPEGEVSIPFAAKGPSQTEEIPEVTEGSPSLWESLKGAGSELVDTVGEKIGDAAGSVGKWSDENPNALENIMIGATPVLMGYLTGHKEEGYTWASKGLMKRYDEERKDYSAFRKQQLTSKTAAGKKTPSVRSVRGPDGISYDHQYDPAHPQANAAGWFNTGMITGSAKKDVGQTRIANREALDLYGKKRAINLESDVLKAQQLGSTKSYKTDEQGRMYEVDKSSMGAPPRLVFNPEGLTPTQKKTAAPIVKQFNSETQVYRDSLTNLRSNIEMLALNNQFSNKIALRKMITAIEPRLTDKDAAYYTSSVSMWQGLREELSKFEGDVVPDRLIREAMEVASIFNEAYSSNLENRRDHYRSQLMGAESELTRERADKLFGAPTRSNMPTITIGRLNPETEKIEKLEVRPDEVHQFATRGFNIIRD